MKSPADSSCIGIDAVSLRNASTSIGLRGRSKSLEPHDRLAAPRDAHIFAGFRTVEEFAQTGLGVGQTDAVHDTLLTIWLVRYNIKLRAFERSAASPPPVFPVEMRQHGAAHQFQAF
jgi:hypothetical protein